MCEKEFPERDEFGIREGLLVPSIFVLDALERKSQRGRSRCEIYLILLMITHIPVP